jgi:ribosomal-protein-alanine N-acetyltransferase
MNRLVIRRAVGGDAGLLAGLHADAFDSPWQEASFKSLLNERSTSALLALPAAEAPADAFILFRCAADEAEILTLATAKPARRQGLASALVRAASEEARMKGAEKMFLEVATDNVAALALYRGLGFREAGLRRGYYRTGDAAKDALVLNAGLPLA